MQWETDMWNPLIDEKTLVGWLAVVPSAE